MALPCRSVEKGAKVAFLVKSLISDLERVQTIRYFGKVEGVQGLLVEASGLRHALSVGDRCQILARDRKVMCEAVGFRQGRALLMPFTTLDGVGLGCRVEVLDGNPVLYPHPGWLGRCINALGEPVDGLGPLPVGDVPYPVRAMPPSAHSRQRVAG